MDQIEELMKLKEDLQQMTEDEKDMLRKYIHLIMEVRRIKKMPDIILPDNPEK